MKEEITHLEETLYLQSTNSENTSAYLVISFWIDRRINYLCKTMPNLALLMISERCFKMSHLILRKYIYLHFLSSITYRIIQRLQISFSILRYFAQHLCHNESL